VRSAGKRRPVPGASRGLPGVFIQVTDAGRDVDVPIPGRPYTFGTLVDAAGGPPGAAGPGRRVARVDPGELAGLAECG